ncbi:class I SAM-dependent methyltransferase [Cochlodiniinecator piscidefendens]|uniref:class I SAM-dependent methyltransferase n=1 Tax=Cochlodiniinecator piscidefendens TaxID=2715756 RepID=UPI00140A366A|nr:methyltransferase domain-containing protein [Cochlodiniinecator piscidefendens]
MHLDVLDLRTFYYRSTLGRSAQKAVRDQVRSMWPDAQGQTVVGFGFAVPLLRPYLGEARRVVGLMPAQQGVMSWPAGMRNVSALCEEISWPLQTGSVDKLVLMHGYETCDNPTALLEECWRVLGPGGKALFIVPNRAGLWARSDLTPFGYGRPYSLSQLEQQLKRHDFVPERHRAALFSPPSNKRFWLKSAQFLERTGQKFSSYYAGGVVMLEVRKQVLAPTNTGTAVPIRRPLRVLEGLKQPEVKPI